ncbi:MAG: hypothetical protein KU28_12215 [Sulfurovum sp. PC08-66]|nr:MAG: hypothetical protein KU28_12215 [Sulfurovum sp. PC08-66]
MKTTNVTKIIGAIIMATTVANAQPNIDPAQFKGKISEAAGKVGQFAIKGEDFPKDYFLVSSNLPFLVGLSLHHPQSSTLKLSKEQLEAIDKIKNQTVPEVLKVSKKIKNLELQIAQSIAIDSQTPESQYATLEEIAQLRLSLSKEHLKCIKDVRAILTKEQYEILLGYGSNK